MHRYDGRKSLVLNLTVTVVYGRNRTKVGRYREVCVVKGSVGRIRFPLTKGLFWCIITKNGRGGKMCEDLHNENDYLDDDEDELITIHSDYTKMPEDHVLNQIIYDLEHAKRKLYIEDFPPLEIVNGLVDISVEYDVGLARRFYLRMSECFAEDDAWVAEREFAYPKFWGFSLPCDYQEAVYDALGFNEDTRPESGCPYCPYVSFFGKCFYRFNFSPLVRIFYIKNIVSLAKYKFDVCMPNANQFDYVVRHLGDFGKHWSSNLSWLTLEKARLVWKKSYELLAYWPIKEGVKIKGEN